MPEYQYLYRFYSILHILFSASTLYLKNKSLQSEAQTSSQRFRNSPLPVTSSQRFRKMFQKKPPVRGVTPPIRGKSGSPLVSSQRQILQSENLHLQSEVSLPRPYNQNSTSTLDIYIVRIYSKLTIYNLKFFINHLVLYKYSTQ